MNRTKITLLALAALMAASAAMSACGSVCNHMDNDGNKLCDLCGSSMETQAVTEAESVTTPTSGGETVAETEPAVQVNSTIAVKDQYGKPISGAVLQINDTSNKPVETATTDPGGVAHVTLPEGSYTVVFLELPEYHLGGTMKMEIKSDAATVELEIINNTPDGSEAHPFFLNSETATFAFEANTTYHFSLFAGDRRSIVIENAADITITLEGTTHTADENGLIKVPVMVDNQQNHLSLSVTSKVAQDVTIGIVADLGSSDNPIVIEALGTEITAIVPKDRIMHFIFTVTEDGQYTVTSADPTNNISLTNRTTSAATNFTNGAAESAELAAKAGDVITVSVSILGGDASLDSYSLTFTLQKKTA